MGAGRLNRGVAMVQSMSELDKLSSTPNATVTVGSVTIANDRPLALIAGPCQMESRAHAL